MEIKQVEAYEYNGCIYKTKEQAERAAQLHMYQDLVECFETEHDNGVDSLVSFINKLIYYGITSKSKLVLLKENL